MDKKGLSIILVLGILVILIIGSSSFIAMTNAESRLVGQANDSIRAFYLADAGVQAAVYRMQDGDFSNFQGTLYEGAGYGGPGTYEYSVVVTGSSPSYTVTSTGCYPNSAATGNIVRQVQANVLVTPNGSPGSVTNTISLNGTLSVGGGADVTGTTDENASLDFETTFGMTKAQFKAIANNDYTDPANNTLPVSGITWVTLVGESNFQITESAWSGSGILVVQAPADSTKAALDMTGGTFTGIIWVIGNLSISGNPNISGAIFVENGTAEVAKVTGTPVIGYSSDAVNAAFGNLGSEVSTVANWHEVM